MSRGVTRLLLAGALVAACAPPANAKIEGYPYLDNETLGLFHSIQDAVAGPVDTFEEVHWGLTLLSAIDGGDGMNPLRYFIAFSGYAVAQTSVYTPAWRAPYQQALEGYIEKMMLPLAWRDWLEVWGGDNPLGPDNIMYSGHLVYMMTLHRQLFGSTRYEDGFTLTWLDQETLVESDTQALTQWLADQAEAYVDANGEPIFSIACEPGRVFVPCNGPHRASQLIHDQLYGTQFASTNDSWVDWMQTRLLDEELGVLHELYFPWGKWQPGPEAGEAPMVHKNTSGLYNGWSIWFMQAFDSAWSVELFEAWRAHYVVSGEASPYADGRTVVMDKAGLDGLGALAFEVGATGFGLILTRLFPDPDLHAALRASWDKQFGEPVWDDSGRRFSWANPVFPRLIQNGFPLLALTTSPERNIGTNAALVREAAFFEAPFLASISDAGVFVNQAVWDAEQEKLIVTINGGDATTAAVVITLVGLDPAREWQVERDGQPWDGLVWNDGGAELTTAALTSQESSYVVSEAPPAPPEPKPPAEPTAPESQPEPRAAEEAAPEPAGDDVATPAETSDSGGCSAGTGRQTSSPALLILLVLMGLTVRRRGAPA